MNVIMVYLFWSIITLSDIETGPISKYKQFRLSAEHVALDGFDPVTYFQSGPMKGKPGLIYDFKRVNYLFANEENKNTFIADPSKYQPAWGGWCGYAMALRGEKVEINPLCYKIIQGRNVLFYKTIWTNSLKQW